MKKIILLLAFLIYISATFADIDDKIDDIVAYAEDYELGKINYLQLVVLGSGIRQEISDQLGQEYSVNDDWTRKGLSIDQAKQLFGKPTEMTHWVWNINEEHEEYLDNALPTWEKRLFDGRKILITFNAWPHMIRKDKETITFYEVDFDIRFKIHYNFDLDDMLSDVKLSVEKYLNNKNSGTEWVQKISEYEHFLHEYVKQNNDDCEDVMQEFFDVGQKREQQQKIRIRTVAYEGKNIVLILNADGCENCEWPYIYIWFDIEAREKGFEDKGPSEKNIEKYKEYSTDELEEELEKILSDLVGLVKESDSKKKSTDSQKMADLYTSLDMINRVMDEKYYDHSWNRQEIFSDRIDYLTKLFKKYGNVETEAITETRYENRLVEEYDEVTFKACREQRVSCNVDEGCLDGKCIEASGGIEDCHNGIDDDKDGITDCPDPDCAADCGWICRDICQEGCWSCPEKECRSECQECWNCKGDDCESVCQDTCWKCQREKCESQPICKDCTNCEKSAREEYEEEKCKRICADDSDSEECSQCQIDLKYRQCSDACEDTCWNCNREKCYDSGLCQSCWDCRHDGNNDCEKECRECTDCEETQCRNTDVCKKCKKCESDVWKEIEKEKCDKTCEKCEDCDECKDCRIQEKRHICDDVCEDKCWPCNQEKCIDECEDCWSCDWEKDQAKCDRICKDCWGCTEQKCRTQEFCQSCIECEDRIYKEEFPCQLPCDICNDCTDKGDKREEYCIASCDECTDCESPDSAKQCKKACDRLIEGSDKEQRQKCYFLCDEEVVFYCAGAPQNTPCTNLEYFCDWGIQKIPCKYYKCPQEDGSVVNQNVFCGTEKQCGSHRSWKDGLCACDSGWHDCDDNSKNGCESEEPCEGVVEFCNDNKDNDFDDLIDCQDLIDCEAKQCDLFGDLVCKQGSCIKKCPENFVLSGDKCMPEEVCMVGYDYDENGKCVKPEECLTEGKRSEAENNCCEGLSAISAQVGDGSICSLSAGYICTGLCGNGVCDAATENPCNCPSDCAQTHNITACSMDSDCGESSCLQIADKCQEISYACNDGNCSMASEEYTGYSCAKDYSPELAYPESAKCIDTCGDGECKEPETEEWCPEDCMECTKEGEIISNNLKCCEGLSEIYTAEEGECGSDIVCTGLCGDGICKDENECTCPEDCLSVEENASCTVDSDCGTDHCVQGRAACREITYACNEGTCSMDTAPYPGYSCAKDYSSELEYPENAKCLDKCGDGECKDPETEALCPEDCIIPECIAGDEQTTTCASGEVIITAKCINNAWEYSDEKCQIGCTQCGDNCVAKDMAVGCPEASKEIECIEKEGECVIQEKKGDCDDGKVLMCHNSINEICIAEEAVDAHLAQGDYTGKCHEIECPDGYYFEDGKCRFIEDEKKVCTDWQVLNDKGICEDIGKNEEEPVNEDIIVTEKRCSVREDCEDENAICSKGICKILQVLDDEEIISDTIEITENVESEPDKAVVPETTEPILVEEAVEPESIDVKPDKPEKDITNEPEDEPDHAVDETLEPEVVEDDEKPDNEADLTFPTGSFVYSDKLIVNMLTGNVVKESECESDKDCGPNRGCDVYDGRCFCRETYFDCNGNGNGDDKDGCESRDATCGGKWEACRQKCMPNQECIEEIGRCECIKGYYECDGDWENGCESKTECNGCTSDKECAPGRCNDWDNSLIKFSCVEDYSRREETMVISFAGGCNMKASGKTETYLTFDMWGKDLEGIMRKEPDEKGWCKRELEPLMKQRKALEDAFDMDFLKWFFEDYVSSAPEKWQNQIEGIFATYWRFVENAERLSEVSECMGESLDVNLINIEYKTEAGHVHFWEEINSYDGKKMLTPFMEIWIFPSKEFMKEEFKTAMTEGRIPGPKDEGFSPKDIENLRKDDKLMKKITDLSNKYGNGADFYVQIKDGDEALFRVHVNVNPEDVFEFEILSEDYQGDADIEVEVEFNFLYETIRSFEEQGQLESPPWAKKPQHKIQEAINGGKMIARITTAILSGRIKVSPFTATPTVLDFMGMFAGGK